MPRTSVTATKQQRCLFCETNHAWNEHGAKLRMLWYDYRAPSEEQLTRELTDMGYLVIDDEPVQVDRLELMLTELPSHEAELQARTSHGARTAKAARRAGRNRVEYLNRLAEADPSTVPQQSAKSKLRDQRSDKHTEAVKAERRAKRLAGLQLQEGRDDYSDQHFDKETHESRICPDECAFVDRTPSVENVHELALMGADDSNDVDLSELYWTADQVMRDDNAGSDLYTQDGAVVRINWGEGGDLRGVFGENAYDKFANPGFSIKTRV